jgi:hypothetical protein
MIRIRPPGFCPEAFLSTFSLYKIWMVIAMVNQNTGVTQNFGKGSKIAKKTGGREEEEAA